jgi:2-oxo-hept-3-ene-1,7-dioate hydratase
MLSDEERAVVVENLMQAHADKVQTKRASLLYPAIEIEDSYAISSEVKWRMEAAGATLIGHKIGLTSKAMQRAAGIDEPDFGYLFDHHLMADGAQVRLADYLQPRLELELTFVLGAPLKGPGVSLLDVMRATEYVVPSMEIIDARFEGQRIITDNIADNAAAAGIILGGTPIRPHDRDLRTITGVLSKNADIEETGIACGVMGHPAAAIAWLANKLAEFDVTLKAGHMMLSGSFVRPVFAEAGDTIRADFGDLGAVSAHFI